MSYPAATVIGTNLVIDYGSEEAARAALDSWSSEPPCEHEWEVRVSTSGGTVIPSPSRAMGHVAVLPDARWECVKCGTLRDARFARGNIAALPTQASDSPEKP